MATGFGSLATNVYAGTTAVDPAHDTISYDSIKRIAREVLGQELRSLTDEIKQLKAQAEPIKAMRNRLSGWLT